jgi:3-hydroxyacyl-CoA dehydrogenase
VERRVAVLGAGKIGRAFVGVLARSGVEVVATARSEETLRRPPGWVRA